MLQRIFTSILRPRRAISQCPVVYTDGSCLNQGNAAAKAGFGNFWGPDHPLNCSCSLSGYQDCQRAELKAVEHAMITAISLNYKTLELCSDSQTVIIVLTSSRSLEKFSPKIRDDVAAIRSIMCHVSVKVVKVSAHSGDFGNDEAHKLAKIGAKQGNR